MREKKYKHLLAYSLLIVSSAIGAPGVAHAAPGSFKELVSQLIGLIDLATFALFGVAILIFFWGVVNNLWGYDAGNAEQKQKLKTTLVWGVLIIFVMVSLWGIIAILQSTLSRGL